jgi:hypothetical protein
VYVFNVPYLNYCIFHYVTLNGFDNNVIICWYIIFYELFVLNFIIKMYYVIQKKNLSFGWNVRKIMMVKEIKCLQDIIIEMYWIVRFTCNFFQFQFFKN